VDYLYIPVYVHGRRKKSSTRRKSNDGRIKEAWWAEPTDRPLQRNECSVARALRSRFQKIRHSALLRAVGGSYLNESLPRVAGSWTESTHSTQYCSASGMDFISKHTYIYRNQYTFCMHVSIFTYRRANVSVKYTQ
jgi:hypothetical protein